jgi:hypothetical protein
MELWQMDVVSRIHLTDGTQLHCITGIDDHSRFVVSAKLVARATAKPVCDALLLALERHGVPEEILTDNGKVLTGKIQNRPTNVLFDRICLNNGIKHRLTEPYSPRTTGKVERLHCTMRREFFELQTYDTLEAAHIALDKWVRDYNTQRPHQSLGDVAPMRRFELRRRESLEVIDGEVTTKEREVLTAKSLSRVVDEKGRVSVLRFRYHVGKAFVGETVEVASEGGLMNAPHNGVVIATHAKRHLPEADEAFTNRPSAARPTKGDEVLGSVDHQGAVSFAGVSYRAGNPYRGMTAGVRIVGDTVQVTIDGKLIRTHKARHDRSKEFGALAMPNGKPRRKDVA